MNRLTERIKNQKGAALVEFAIVLPLLLVPSIAAEITKVFLRRRAERIEGVSALPA